MRLIPISLILLLSIGLFTGCTEEIDKPTLGAKFTTYSTQNESVIFSGKLYINTILENAEYEKIPKINKLISSELNTFKQGIYLDSGVYFSIEGLLLPDGRPSVLHVFAKIKNKKSLQEKIASLGLLLEHTKNLDYAIGPNFSIGLQDDIVILRYQEHGNITPHHFTKLFHTLNKLEHTTKEMLSTDKSTAIQFTTHLAHMYHLYAKNTDIHLTDIKQKEVQTLLTGARLSTTLKFVSGGITIQTSHHFSNALKKRLFFENSSRASLGKLAPGKATSGISVQFNPLKIQTLLEDFSPDLLQKLGSMDGNMSLALMALGNRPVTNLFGGELAFIYYGSSDSHSFHLTLGDQGQTISEISRSFFGSNPLYALTINEKEISASSKNHIPSLRNLELPLFFNDFGTHGIDCFMDMEHYNKTQPLSIQEYPFLGAISWVKISVNNEGSTIRIQGKDPKIGILKQISNVYLNKLRDAVGLN